jgi:integrase
VEVKKRVWIEKDFGEFNLSEMDKYMVEFERLISEGYIDTVTKFKDNNWIIKKRGEELSLIFLNDIELKNISKKLKKSKEFINNGMKSLMLDDIEHKSFITVRQKIQLFKSVLRSIVDGVQLEVFCYQMSYLEKFDEFMGGICSQYIEVLSENAIERCYKTRRLVSFPSVFKFNEIIESFYIKHKNNIDVLLKWYPVIIWWKLTSVIPLRPSELINIERNCLEKSNGQYFITLKRSIGKSIGYKFGNTSIEENCYYDDEVRIDKKMYTLLKKYLDDMKNIEGKFLFSKELYISLRRFSPSLNKNKFIVANLYWLLERFYQEIVQNEYNYRIYNRNERSFEELEEIDIEKITLYDTRHIAIVNAIFLGKEIETVQRLAGHEDINTTYSYFQHQHEYTKSFALSFSKKMLHKDDIKKIPHMRKFNKSNHGSLLTNVVLKTNDKTSSVVKVFKSYGGYCNYDIDNDISFCMKFLPSHRLCPHFIPYDEDAQIAETETRLGNCIKVLCDIIKNRENTASFNEKISIQRDIMINNTYELAHILVKKEN